MHDHRVRAPVVLGLVLCSGVLLVFAAGVTAWARDEQLAARAQQLNNDGVREALAGRFEAGVERLREALALVPSDAHVRGNLSGMLTDWARVLERRGDVAAAEAALEEAASLDPANGSALALLGDLQYFHHSDFDRALALWRRAHAAAPAEARQGLADRISQAERDRYVERDAAVTRTPHFELRLPRSAQADLSTVRPLLEDEYARLEREFGTGPARVTVIVYAAGDLARLYYQRDWAVGFYDGRLRLRDVELGAPEAPVLIAHELTHVFLQHAYGAAVPVWVHEGYAQAREGTVPGNDETRRLVERLRTRTDWIPLAWLDRRFSQPTSDDDIHRAYAAARVTVEALVARHGLPQLHAFLRRLAAGEAVEPAFEAAFAPLAWAKANQGIFD